jgi:hypothetical protein
MRYLIPGETVLLTDLDEKLYKRLADKWGPRIVFQVCEMTTGGGTGTAFIDSEDDFHLFVNKFKTKKEIFHFINNVNITSFIDGIPGSIVACATRYGVITGPIQTQILTFRRAGCERRIGFFPDTIFRTVMMI